MIAILTQTDNDENSVLSTRHSCIVRELSTNYRQTWAPDKTFARPVSIGLPTPYGADSLLMRLPFKSPAYTFVSSCIILARRETVRLGHCEASYKLAPNVALLCALEVG